MALHGEVYESDQSDIRGPIKINHHKIGEWQAVCQPGKDGIHPYRWGATLNGVSVRGVLTHTRADGALVLASKVTAAAAIALAEATRAAESPATPDLDSDSNPPQGRTQPRPEFLALIDAFQPEYDALLRERMEEQR